MKRTLFIILAVVAVFLIIGFSFTSLSRQRSDVFSTSPSFGFGGGSVATEAPAAMEPPMAAPELAKDAATGEEFSYEGQTQAQERLVIENADLAIVVKDPKTRMAEINALANEFGGVVVFSHMYQ